MEPYVLNVHNFNSDTTAHYDVVYKISYHDCDTSYIGQTKRQLKTGIAEHVSDVNKKSDSLSVINNESFHKRLLR